ncbi:MAG: hypothetical protein J6T01_05725 [Kiritimatiellae bacterium]|nr:hypothetical protein [Kiritimatiellia bacterium]
MKIIPLTLLALAPIAGFADELDMLLAPVTNDMQVKTFTTLPFCRRIEGRAAVCKPGGEWIEAEEGRFYPFGTSFRAGKGSSMTVAFGPVSTVKIADGDEFATRVQKLGLPSRTVVLVRGTLEVKLPDNLPEGSFFVTAPSFTVKNQTGAVVTNLADFTIKNPAGESRISYVDMGDGDSATIRCVTGALSVEGRHFDIPVMHSADELVIRTSRDHLFTSLSGTSGDYVVNVDQGLQLKPEFSDDGRQRDVVVKGNLEWHLTPCTKIVISRSVPAIGERMSVHTMAFDAAGERKSECCFSEGRAEVNTGEIVPKSKVDSEELAKKAAEATETTEAAPKDAAAEGDAAGGDSAEEGKTDGGETTADGAKDEAESSQ